MPQFIETQFPIVRLSAESYKERKAGASQTLTGVGKWWGRKPLVLVRAAILGMLMPASDNPKRDREIFLKIMTMDDEGTWLRCKPAVQRKTNPDEFGSLPYAERIKSCERPENFAGPSPLAWHEINDHLGTEAKSLSELVEQLGQRSFGHTPRVGDCFCGGGSIPFEAARIGCEAYGSDLNPVAGLLTWASLNLLGGGKEVQDEVRKVQEKVFAEADRQIIEWGIEHNERGERAEAFLHCVEVKPEGCSYYIPLAPNWIVSEKYQVVVQWSRLDGSDRLLPDVVGVSAQELAQYKAGLGATVVSGRVTDPFNPERSWSIESMRGPEGLRLWTNDDVVPRPGDVFQERLYCIRWINDNGNRRYAAPEASDLTREEKVLQLFQERFDEWQENGFIPSKAIIKGYNTEQPIRERGWTHWHHLFTPRQLLVHGVLLERAIVYSNNKMLIAACSLGIASCGNWNSKLCQWTAQLARSGGIGAFAQTFYNQALNPLYNWGVRPIIGIQDFFSFKTYSGDATFRKGITSILDARDLDVIADYWITDPPYADAVNYHELGDFFLAWYDKHLAKAFPEWIPDARTELAVRGDGDDFRHSMVEIYRNLAGHMPDNGMQMVMFTHQNPAVWADLGMILWAAGLKATAAWTISTETEAAGIKKGNYVQGTVCLVLRKRLGNEPGFLDEIYPMVEDEVRRQIDSMQSLDEGGEPNFNDADFQLAAYAAGLKVLTQFGTIDGRNVEHEVFSVRAKNEKSDFQWVIERAIGIACEYLVPKGLEVHWRDLSLVERFYLRSLDIESRGERRKGMYEELARGFGVHDIKPLLKSDKANGARMHTASGFESKFLESPNASDQVTSSTLGRRGRTSQSGPHPFAISGLRHLLFAIRETGFADNNPEPGRQYLKDTFESSYWNHRERFVHLLDWLSSLGNSASMKDWPADSESARILAGRLRNDQS